MQLTEGLLFDNRYTLVRLIGRGGFSEVWLAQDKITELSIALKIYAPGQGMDNDGLNIFSQELKSVFHLSHANLLKPNHMGTWQNQPYLIMEYCSRGSITKQVGKMSEQEVWKVLHDVASGLAYLHSKEIVHQDIKPDNILLDDEGNYRITDFGISTKARTTLRKSVGAAAAVSGGTMAYMGPERFSAQPAPTKASDIWALGATLFELLTGDVPFGEVGGGMQKNGAEIPDIVLPDKSTVSPALTHVIRLMLSLNTWDRPTADTLVTWAADPTALHFAGSQKEKGTATIGQETTVAGTPHSRPTTMQGTPTSKPTLEEKKPHSPQPQQIKPEVRQIPETSKKSTWWKWALGIVIGLIAIIVACVGHHERKEEFVSMYAYHYNECKKIIGIANSYDQFIDSMTLPILRRHYKNLCDMEKGSHSSWIPYFQSSSIKREWNKKVDDEIQKNQTNAQKEFQNWKYSKTYYSYKNKVDNLQKCKL